MSINPLAATAIVEQCWHGYSLRWWFVLKDEEGSTVHLGEKRETKLEAMNDRGSMVRAAQDWRRKVDERYASWDDPEAKLYRVALRAVYETRDQAKAPGR